MIQIQTTGHSRNAAARLCRAGSAQRRNGARICEQGFSFRAIAPLKADGPVNFAFALDGNRRLQGTGEIAWSEEDGKTGA